MQPPASDPADPPLAGALLNDAANRLASISETPRFDAELMLAHAWSISRASLLARLREIAPREAFEALVQRRLTGEPLAYIFGEWEFFSIPLFIEPPILVPRPETEHLVEAVLEFIGERPARVIDVCTGSGCVAIAIAENAPRTQILATDISPKALRLAACNIGRHELEDRMRVVRADLLDAFAGRFDVVCANPPYIVDADWESLMPSVRNFEDPGALLAGADGLDIARRLAAQARDLLRPGGLLAFEIGMGQHEAVTQFLHEMGYTSVAVRPDLAGIPRIATGIRP